MPILRALSRGSNSGLFTLIAVITAIVILHSLRINKKTEQDTSTHRIVRVP